MFRLHFPHSWAADNEFHFCDPNRVPSPSGGPAWRIALHYTDQGRWSEEDQLSLDTWRLIEFDDGRIDVLPMPSADLVMEVVSEGGENRRRDGAKKRGEYARAGIAEYWIVDPEVRQIAVLTLDAGSYRVHGTFGNGQAATSLLLPGFQVDVDALFAAGEHPTKPSSGEGAEAVQ